MSYFAHEKWRVGPHRAIVHISTCGFCNNGQGLTAGASPLNGKWHGPFTTLRAAQSAVPGVWVRQCRCVAIMTSPGYDNLVHDLGRPRGYIAVDSHLLPDTR